ncbi:transcriptional regulator of acetoin/glycerol metabolism [Tamaricihabitans halophyticus]|uniref:Transcriptional regulator of acetoin/glycerol metabolism n=1 Tax=Tamaricihabitans halophyticus TaxID=1262583 RepID=A0A4R2QWQ2_9PSEU|nr:helix-turn-helix domain-containing protein [Tamaricihabitans halophyticus]TCP54137.1 transcriptional regulator of acetoin/glycerol metabolism [Tamaricihabitans halophyticus]
MTEASLRTEIADSWRRSERSGLDPAAGTDRLPVHDIDQDTELVRAARPVLDEMARHLADTGYCVALADRDCHIVARRFGGRNVEQALDSIGALPGSKFDEASTGTNAIATPFVLRRGVAIHGAEHFLHSFKQFTCYGQPIFHPVSKQLAGVLDITGLTKDDNPLLAPFVVRAVADIEQRLCASAADGERLLLAAFQAAQHRTSALLALGPGVVFANTAAIDLVDPTDHALFRELARRPSPSAKRLRLAGGTSVRVCAEPIGSEVGTLFTLTPLTETAEAIPRGRTDTRLLPSQIEQDIARYTRNRDRVLIAGEPGTGRSSTAALLAGAAPLAWLPGADLPTLGASAWCARLDTLIATHPGLVVVEDVHLLPRMLATRLSHLLDSTDAWLALTGTPEHTEPGQTGELAALLARLPHRVELPPLRTRRAELPALARTMLSTMAPGRSLRLTPSALEILATQPWPGNLRELSAVLRQCVERRSAGDITPRDLPPAYQQAAIHPRTGWEQAEYDAITRALRAARGNKVHAARDLGISRSTLYNRIRTLGINT